MRFRLWIRWTRKHYNIRYPVYMKQSSSVQQIQASLKCSECVPTSCSSKMQRGWCISRAERKFLKLLVAEGKQIMCKLWFPSQPLKCSVTQFGYFLLSASFISKESVLRERQKPLLLLFEKNKKWNRTWFWQLQLS